MISRARTIGLTVVVALPIAALAIAAAGWMSTQPIGAVRIAGEFGEVSRARLRAVIAPALEGGFFRIDVDEVREAALTLPWVREAAVRRVWPDSIHVAVVEREAVARWNESALLESDGTVFEPTQLSDETARLVRLVGPPGEHASVLGAHERLAAALGSFGRGIERLSLSARGEWRLEFASGLVLIPSTPLDVDAVREMTRVLPGLLGAELERVAVLDLRYANGFAVRWREEAEQVTTTAKSTTGGSG